jgi:hypothetical protein
MSKTTIPHTVNVLGQSLDIDFQVSYYVDNDSIGCYEYWGSQEHHSGSDYPVIEDMTWDESLFDTWQNAEIKRLSETENLILELTEQIIL